MSNNTGRFYKRSKIIRRVPISRKPKRLSVQTKAKQSPEDQVLHLQRTVGNRAVNRLIQSGAIQAKLTIGTPNDKYEQEADRVADRVMGMKDRPLVQRQIEEDEEVQAKRLVQRQEEEEKEEPVQSKGGTGRTPNIIPTIESDIDSMKGSGRPLSESTRAFFEPRFGADFSHVRVHTGSKAAETARAVNAKAFTTGKDVVFGPGQYSPETSSGKRLLAHELTHTLQQSKAPGASTGRTINRKTKGEVTREEAKKWLDVESKLKIEVDVLKAALKEIKREKSVGYNKNAGLMRLDNAGGILNITGNALTELKENWKWLVDNRKQNTQKTYKENQAKFFNELKSPLEKTKKKYPLSQTHYWLKNTPAQIFDVMHKVGDADMPAIDLWVYASKEGLVAYIRDQLGLSQKADPSDAQLKTVSVTEEVSGFEYMGLDDFFTELNTRRQPLKAFLPSGFDLSKVKKDARINEKGRTVQSGIFPNLLMAVQALSAMMKRRRKIFQEDRKSLGYPEPNRDELVYWTYVYYNSGIYGGKEVLKKYKDKKDLSYLITRGNYPNAIKVLQSFQMVKEMKLF